jgi:hypothetical protein
MQAWRNALDSTRLRRAPEPRRIGQRHHTQAALAAGQPQHEHRDDDHADHAAHEAHGVGAGTIECQDRCRHDRRQDQAGGRGSNASLPPTHQRHQQQEGAEHQERPGEHALWTLREINCRSKGYEINELRSGCKPAIVPPVEPGGGSQAGRPQHIATDQNLGQRRITQGNVGRKQNPGHEQDRHRKAAQRQYLATAPGIHVKNLQPCRPPYSKSYVAPAVDMQSDCAPGGCAFALTIVTDKTMPLTKFASS